MRSRDARTVDVRLGQRSYKIVISSGIIKRIGPYLARLPIGKDFVIITNPNLSSSYKSVLKGSIEKEGFTSRFVLMAEGEKAKSEKAISRAIAEISGFDRKKALSIIAFGGGVVGDAAGFIAAIYKRGIPYVQVPTTLLAQVDSAIGGKVAIDLPCAKNLIGAFYQPKLVLSDISILKSLPPRQIRSGLAEVIKYGVIADPRLFEYIEGHLNDIAGLDEDALRFIVSRCSAIKAGIVEADEFDRKGRRIILNYGHTIGHALEAASGYSKAYTHGEAISLGMAAANRIATRLGILDETVSDRINSLLKASGLPTAIKKLDPKKIYEAHLKDKKFSGSVNRFVLPVKIGRVRVEKDIKEAVIRRSLEECYGG